MAPNKSAGQHNASVNEVHCPRIRVVDAKQKTKKKKNGKQQVHPNLSKNVISLEASLGARVPAQIFSLTSLKSIPRPCSTCIVQSFLIIIILILACFGQKSKDS